VIRDGGGRVIGFLGSVSQRNVYGPGEDEILAVDRVNGGASGGAAGSFWTLADRQGTVRDIVSGNAADRGKVVEHRQYDSYGKLVSRTTSPVAGSPVTAGVGIDFGYAGRPLEERTGLSDNRARWYEPGTGRFVNEDPSGFKGGDANLFRYVGNDPLNRIDPSGLIAKWAQPASRTSVPATGWAAVGQGANTTPAVGSSRMIVSPPTPTFSLTSPASPKATATQSPAFSSLRTTVSDTRGTIYTPPLISTAAQTESRRWTVLDRVTKLASNKSYDVNDGGLLPQFVKNYDATGKTGKFGGQGFSAALSRASEHAPYASEDTYILALRGTNGLNDWRTNILQFFGFKTSQYDQAIDLAREVKNSLPPGARLIVTGHSKGGGQAVAAAYATGIRSARSQPRFGESGLLAGPEAGQNRTSRSLGTS
jgi:RHS repeat-associated protein